MRGGAAWTLENRIKHHCTPRGGEDGWVYFVLSPCKTAMKVGFSEHPLERMAQLSTGWWAPPAGFKAFCGSVALERRIHSELSGYRMNGEWFRFDGKVAGLFESTDDCFAYHQKEQLFAAMRMVERSRAVAVGAV